jgi:nucleotide-binding universal stress UspA family protein
MFEHILVPLDESPAAECVLPHVTAIAQLTGARITLMRVLEGPTTAGNVQPTDPVAWQLHQDAAASYLADIARRLEARGLSVDVRIYEGDPATTIIDHVRDERVDLVALASHGRTGVTGAELGAVALKTILGIHVPLLLVRAFGAGRRDADATRYRKVLVALDGSRRAECALPVVHRIADEHGAALLLGHVVREPEVPHRLPLGQDEQAVVDGLGALARRHATAYLDALRDDLAGAGRSVSVHVLSGNDPVTELEAFAEHEDVDLILMSAHGATGTTRRPFGAIAEKFVLYGSRPILIVQDRSRDEIEASPARAAARQRAGHS